MRGIFPFDVQLH